MNALKHGLSSQEIVIFDEDPLEFEGLRAALEEAFQPVDAFERELVDQLAGLFWRLRRIPKLEAGVLDSRPEDSLNYVFQVADRDTRKKVLERLRQLQQARDEEKRGEKIGFSADLAQALYREMPEVLGSLAEAEEGRNTDKPWAAIARHETSLRNGVSRIFSLLHAHRAAGLMQG